MASPANAVATKDGRFYHWKDDPAYISSTNALEAMRKKALEYWGPKAVAEYVADNMEVIRAVMTESPTAMTKAAAIDLMKRSPYRTSDEASGIGSLIHEVAEARALGLPTPEHEEKHEGFIRSLDMFLDEWQPEFVHTEMTVYNRRYGYAGTLDGIMDAGRVRYLFDWKTTKPGKQGHGIYPEAALQMASYRFAEFGGMPNGTELPMPEVDECVGINLRPNGYKVVPVSADEAVFKVFLHVLQVARFQKEMDSLIGSPLAPPLRVVA